MMPLDAGRLPLPPLLPRGLEAPRHALLEAVVEADDDRVLPLPQGEEDLLVAQRATIGVEVLGEGLPVEDNLYTIAAPKFEEDVLVLIGFDFLRQEVVLQDGGRNGALGLLGWSTILLRPVRDVPVEEAEGRSLPFGGSHADAARLHLQVIGFASVEGDCARALPVDGEGQLTSAINYVISEDMPVLYTLEGHDEVSMGTAMTETIQKANIDIQSLNLLTQEAVPDDAACLLIFSPATDLSEDEANKVIDYLENGGKALILSDYTEEDMPNFQSVLENYGVQTVDGIVMEGDTNHYISQNPYYLLPNIESSDVTSGLSSGSRYVLMALAQGIQTMDNIRDSLNIESILTTSDSAYSKTDLENMQTMEKENGDIDGPFDLGVSITEEVGEDTETRIVYFAASTIFDDTIDSYVSGANYELLSSALSWLCQTDEDSTNTISISSKSLDTSTLTVPAADVSFWSIFVTGIIPVCILLVGFGIWMKRRKQ